MVKTGGVTPNEGNGRYPRFSFKKDTHVQNSVLSQPHGGRGGPFELDAVELIRRPTSSVALLPKRTRDRAAPTLAEQLAVERSRYAESLRGV